MMEVGQLRDPFGARTAKQRGPLITEGSYRNGKTEIYRKGKWEPINVIHAGQRAMVNGKMRTADGKGNWYDPKDPGKYSHETGEFERQTYGTYQKGERKPSTPPYTSNKEVKPSSFLKVETPTQNAERPTTPNNSGAVVPALGGKNYSVMGIEYDYKTGQAINPGTGKPSSGGYSIEPKTSGRTDYRSGETRVGPTGVVQKGTNTSPPPMTMKDANSLLSDGYTMKNPFSSTQLPSSSQSPYANVGPIADGAEYARNLEMQKPGAVTGVGPIADGEQFAKNVEAGQQVVEKSIPKRPSGARQAAMWDRKYGSADFSGKSEAPATSGFDLERRKAFLSGETGMQGLRNMESQMGISYAGGQHRMVNPNATPDGKNDFVSIKEKDDVRGYKSGRLSAQDMKDKYVTKIIDNGITKYDEDKVSTTAGPVADGAAYGQHLQGQQDKYKMSGIGPVADGAQYAKLLGK